ncbi:MAG: hypothetical protein GY866_35710 [Proteobacteria bacterium]|nr:hypothetical protein [Pseudomonadota bacterium]
MILIVAAWPANLFGRDSFLKGSLIIGYKRNQTTFTREGTFEGFSEFEETAKSTEELNPFVTYKTTLRFLFDTNLAWGIEASYGGFALNDFRMINTYDASDNIVLGGSRIAKIVNDIEYEDDIRGNFGYLMPTLSYMFGDDDVYLTLGAGYGVGVVELKKQSTEAKKHDVTITYEDGQETRLSLTEFGTLYANPFQDTGGLSGAYRAFLEIKLWYLYFSARQGGPVWTDEGWQHKLEDTEYNLGLIIDF